MGVDTAIVFYNVWSENFPDNNLFKWGHYKGNGGTKSQVNAAEILNLTPGDISGLEMCMLKGRGAAEKFNNVSTDDSANNGAFAVMQNAASPVPQKVSRFNMQNASISIEPE